MSDVPSVSARLAGTTAFALLLNRLPLIVTAVITLVLFDFAIEGSMREAMRSMVIDAPWQLPLVVASVALAVTAIRFTAEAMAVLVAKDMFGGTDLGGILTRWLPRICALAVGLAAGGPMLQLWLEHMLYGEHILGPISEAQIVLLVTAGLLSGMIGVAGLLWGGGLARAHKRGQRTIGSLFIDLSLTLPMLFGAAILVLGGAFTFLSTDFLTDTVRTHYAPYGVGPLAIHLAGFALAVLAVRFAGQGAIAFVLHILGYLNPTALSRSSMVLAVLVSAASIYVGYKVGSASASDFSVLYASAGAYRDFFALGFTRLCGFAFAVTGLGASLIGLGLGGRSDWFMRIAQRTLEGWTEGREALGQLGREWRHMFVFLMTAAMFIAAILCSPLSVSLAHAMGGVSIILLWGFCATLLFFPLAYLSHMARVPYIGILVTAALLFSAIDLNDNHHLRLLETTQSTEPKRYREHPDLAEWLATRPDLEAYDKAGKPYPVFIVATEGGGLRAAYFTAQVLSALQDLCPGFTQHVYAISGVSGGSVGAAVFAANTAQNARPLTQAGCAAEPSEAGKSRLALRDVLGVDMLSPLLASLLFPDALQRILPFDVPAFDRARALETTLEAAMSAHGCTQAGCAPGTRLEGAFQDLYSDPVTGELVPHLILNAAEVESGLAMPVSSLNLQLSLDRHDDAAYLAAGRVLSAPKQDEGFRCSNDRPGSPNLTSAKGRGLIDRAFNPPAQILQDELPRGAAIPVSTAAMISARFPYLTPAARVDGQICGTRRFVDGGYFENSGAWVVGGLMQSLYAQQILGDAAVSENIAGRDRVVRMLKTAQITLLVIRSTPPCTRVNTADKGCAEEAEANGGWNEVLSPVRALLATRSARSRLSRGDLEAYTRLIALLRSRVEAGPPAPKLIQLSFQNKAGTQIPLTWLLSSAARKPMDEAVDRMISLGQGDPSDQGERNTVRGAVLDLVCAMQLERGASACP